jgi:hypothetical protein
MEMIFRNKYFLFTVGSFCRVNGSQLGDRLSADGEEVETELWKWLRQQSKSSMLRVSTHW